MFSKEFLVFLMIFELIRFVWWYNADFCGIFLDNGWVCVNGTRSWDPLGNVFELTNKTGRLQIIVCLVSYAICLFNCCELLVFETLLWLLLLDSRLFNDLGHRQLFVFTFLSSNNFFTFLPCFNLTRNRRICSTIWRQKVDVPHSFFSDLFWWTKKLVCIL